MSNIVFKVTVNDQLRRISCAPEYNVLMNHLANTILSLDPQNFVIQYYDDEKDLITLSSQMELDEAISLYPNSPVRLQLVVKPPVSDYQEPAYQASRKGEAHPIDLGKSPQMYSREQLMSLKQEKRQLKQRMIQRKQTGQPMSKEERINFIKEVKAIKSQAKQIRQVYKLEKTKIKELKARFIGSSKQQCNFAPGESFMEVFRIRNEGENPWPEGTRLVPIGKNADHPAMGTANKDYKLPSVAPNGVIDIEVPIVAPMKLGQYTALWRLALEDGRKFGPRLSTTFTVVDNSAVMERVVTQPTIQWTALLTDLQNMGFANNQLNIQLLKQYEGKLDLVVEHLFSLQNSCDQMQ